ncbi:MAG: hypothetical protein HFH80_07035 [Lachnospiraceae bacterium]|nr:hypothetical protein [Lachnospiraceae bacterium]
MNLWQKLQFCYRYHWMNLTSTALSYTPAARPLWFLTHTMEQGERRTAAYRERHRKEVEAMKAALQAYLDEMRSRTPFS